jgi:glycosyltransferase involved in cell wall biosynthesis
MKPGVTIITCTGDRPEAFALCLKYIQRQTYTGSLQWIVVDDGVTATEVPSFSRESWFVTYLRPESQPEQNTLARNLLMALPEVLYEKILVFEDDDCYAAGYIEAMEKELDESPLVGEIPSRYYHVPTRKYRIMENHGRASLCQTAFRAELIPVLQSICRAYTDFIDVRFWDHIHQKRLVHSNLCVGIKGLPGRAGIGIGHNPTGPWWNGDPNLAFLRAWIGDDVELYREFMK